MIWYGRIQEPEAPGWMMFSLEFWVVLLVFSLGGHDTDTYRTVVRDDGAFELCLPSLGILYQIELLRSTILGRTLESNGSWGEEGRTLTAWGVGTL